MTGGVVYISRGVNRQYHALVKRRNVRKYTHIMSSRSEAKAAAALAKEMTKTESKRGMVTFTCDYYDPIAVITMVRP